jgi:hypothetical protein
MVKEKAILARVSRCSAIFLGDGVAREGDAAPWRQRACVTLGSSIGGASWERVSSPASQLRGGGKFVSTSKPRAVRGARRRRASCVNVRRVLRRVAERSMESGEFVGAGERRGTAECLVRKIRDGGIYIDWSR